MNFKDFNIIWPIQKTLDKLWFEKPTPIQEEILKISLENKDIFWCAKTGSGKTLSFIISVLTGVYNDKKKDNETILRWLILAPTRELAIQIWEVLKEFATNTNLKYTTIFGWVKQFHQVKQINRNLDLIIATPWRLLDLESQWIVDLSQIKYFVLDEADKMLDMWFFPDIKKILSKLPANKQSLFFSATTDDKIIELSKEITNNFHIIKANKENEINLNINQEIIYLEEKNKKKALQHIVKNKEYKSIVIFVNTKDDTEIVTNYLKLIWINCDHIHRNRSQNARTKALKAMKNCEIKVLVWTDIISRWIDIDDLSCVINYSLPKNPEVYIHRTGRTARAWKTWIAISFYTENEKLRVENIEKLIKTTIPENTDKKYLEEKIVQWEYLWDFDTKPKTTKKKRYYKKKR